MGDQSPHSQRDQSRKRKRGSSPDDARKRPKPLSPISNSDTDLIAYWAESGRWPQKYFESENNMSFPLAQKKSSSSLRRKASESGASTPSDQKPREEKSAPYRHPGYEALLATKNSFMKKSAEGITNTSKDFCRAMLDSEQDPPPHSLFRDDVFDKTCQKLQNRNEAMIIQDIGRLIVPSAQNLAIFGANHLEHLIESVNEGWNESISLTGTRPQPDYSVGFAPSAFTEDQRKKLQPCIGSFTDTSFFVATWRMWFPFLTCEAKCGAGALDVADRQNAHSATLAVRGVVELFRAVKREKQLHREILAFSISHDNSNVRIYGHYPLVEEDKTTYYRHPIHKFDFTALDGKEKWTAYRFTKNVYDQFMPMHLKRICSAVDELAPNVDFGVSEQLDSQVSDDPQHLSQRSEADSLSTIEQNDSQASLAMSQEATLNTSFSEQKFKKPKRGPKV